VRPPSKTSAQPLTVDGTQSALAAISRSAASPGSSSGVFPCGASLGWIVEKGRQEQRVSLKDI
jgi:hypothetical protein